MRSLLRLAGLVALLAALPVVHAAGVSGTWKGAFDFGGTSVPLTFNLTIAGAAVTGTVEGLPTSPAGIHDGKMDGDTVTFWLNTDYQGQTYKLLYTGMVSRARDAIAFTFGTGDQGWSAQLTATRSAETAPAPDLAGTWKGAFDFQSRSVPLTFNLTVAGAAVTGTVEGLPTSPVEIHDGKVDGDTVTFWLNTDYQGETYKLVYKGKITEGQIAFKFGLDDGSWEAELTAVK